MQIRNYLSNIYDVNSVLLISTSKEFLGLVTYLLEAKAVKKLYCINSADNVCKSRDDFKSDVVEYCSREEILKQGIQVDVLLFDRNSREAVLAMQSVNPRYLVGRLSCEEEYFDLWEQFRKTADFIYIEREKAITPEENKNDANKCEILDWVNSRTQIELSIILPVYNVAEYLPKCIETLTFWKAPYVEYLFVNDESTDDSRDIIQRYAESDNRVRLIDKENGGCASARNRGIEEARGRYIGFVDPDDFIEESMYYKLLRRALMGNYELTYCGYNEYYEESSEMEPILNDCLKEPYLTGNYREDKVQLLTVNTRVAIWRAIYQKDVLDKNCIRFHENMKRFDDLPFRVEYIFAAKSAACVPEHLYNYRLGRKGQDVSCTDERLFVHFTMFEYLDTYVDKLKDKRMQDLLQVVKIQTHGYALSKLEKKYRKEYIKRAKKQLDRNMGYWRTVILIFMYTGKGNLGWYTKMKVLG